MSKKFTAALLPMIAGLTTLTAGATLGLWARPALAQNLVPWKDPSENAFSVEAPKEWQIGGGLTRKGKTQVRQSVDAFRADGDLYVQIGDAGLPPFVALNDDMTKSGVKEQETIGTADGGELIVMRLLSADEFNRWWAQGHLTRILDDIKVGVFHSEKELAPKYLAIQQKDIAMKLTTSVAETAFTGKLKANGHEVSFVVFSVVIGSGDSFVAHPIILSWERGEHEAANVHEALATLTDLMGSWRENPEWIHEYDAKAGPNASLKNGASLGQRIGVMGTYWKSQEARREVVSHIGQFIQHIPGGPGGGSTPPPPASNNPFGGLQ